MSTIQNLTLNDAVDKLRQLVENTPTCMLATGLGKVPAHVCPMGIQQVDELGILWMFSGADSVHNSQISGDHRAHLIFCNPAKLEYLTVYGEASISRERRKIDELWTKTAEAWFPRGKDDPNLTLISIKPTAAHYWDTESGKLVTMAKILLASVTGRPGDVGSVEGDLKV